MSEGYVRDLAQRLSALRTQEPREPVTLATLPCHLAGMMASVVQLEQALELDDQDSARRELAQVLAQALIALHDLGTPWCLRSPQRRYGRYRSPADMTGPLRYRLASLWAFLVRRADRDAVIVLELVVKDALELGPLLDFDAAVEAARTLRSA